MTIKTQAGFSASYRGFCQFLLTEIDIKRVFAQQEKLNAGATLDHYRELLPWEVEPSEEFWNVYRQSLSNNGARLAQDAVTLAHGILARADPDKPIVLASLARAGTPFGVIQAAYMTSLGREVYHYSVSLIKGRGIDFNALDYILAKHPDAQLFLLDGWTGKGGISIELARSMELYNLSRNVELPTKLCVICDLAGMAEMAASTDDYMIPSAPIDAPMNGLISRTILNNEELNADDFHGAIIYDHLAASDQSNQFVDAILAQMQGLKSAGLEPREKQRKAGRLVAKSLSQMRRLAGVENDELIRHGFCETVRAMHRGPMRNVYLRNPNQNTAFVELAQSLGIAVFEESSILYECVGIRAE